MKKRILFWVTTLCLSLALVQASPVSAEKNQGQEPEKVQLTEKQKAEIGALYDEIFAKKKEVVAKYVEYGVITKEKGEEMLSWMEKHHQKMKEGNYQPMRHRHHHKGGEMKDDGQPEN